MENAKKISKNSIKTEVKIGQRYGNWTIIGDHILSAKNERKWLCRCNCGTERYVFERSLKSGGSLNCGCERKKKLKDNLAHNLTGRVFGELTVLYPAEKQRKYGGIWWTCRCSCGNLCDVPAHLLVNGKRADCGCAKKNYATKDINGMRFGRLTAIEPTEKRCPKGSVIWKCRCDCGNVVEYSLNNLLYSNLRSCGCQKTEHSLHLAENLNLAGGTSIDQFKDMKPQRNSTTGIRGVYYIKGSYAAKIVIRKKQYYLGVFKTIEEAAEARRDAEDIVQEYIVGHYERWRLKAKESPEWAEQNPIEYDIKKDAEGRLKICAYPAV